MIIMFHSSGGIRVKLVSNLEQIVLYLKLASFTLKRDAYVNRLESVFYAM